MRTALVGLLLLAGVAGLAAALLTGGVEAESEQPSRAITWSSDPQEAVLSVAYGGTLLMYRPVFTLYGDGRLTAEKHSHSGEMIEGDETTLTFEEVQQLLQPLVDSGFLDSDQKQLEARRTWEAELHSADAGHMIVVLRLSSYTKDGEAHGPVRHRIAVQAPMSTAKAHPDIAEYQGLAALSERLHALEIAPAATGQARQ